MYRIANTTRLTIIMSPRSAPFEELQSGCYAKFFKQGTLLDAPHVTLFADKSRGNKGTRQDDQMHRFDFTPKTSELRSMPLFGLSLADIAPTRLRSGVWCFPLPLLRKPYA